MLYLIKHYKDNYLFGIAYKLYGNFLSILYVTMIGVMHQNARQA